MHKATEQEQEDTLLEKLRKLFGDKIAKAFEDESIVDEDAMAELLVRECDASIFQKLGMNFGKVVKLKKEFKSMIPPKFTVGLSPPMTKSKPTMVDLGICDPETRKKYIARRKKVSKLACEKWGNSWPKFNSVEARVELEEFSKGIEESCSVPELGFELQGIMNHIRDFFNEQRRNKKRNGHSSPSTSSSESSNSEASSVAKKRNTSDAKSINNPKLPCTNSQESNSCLSPPLGKKTTSEINKCVPELPSMDMDDSCSTQDEEDSGGDASDDSSNTMILFDDSEQPDTDSDFIFDNIAKTKALPIIKSVTGRLINRDECFRLLKSKFNISHKTLISFTPSQLNGLLARKLIKGKYVAVTKAGDINVLKEIAI